MRKKTKQSNEIQIEDEMKASSNKENAAELENGSGPQPVHDPYQKFKNLLPNLTVMVNFLVF